MENPVIDLKGLTKCYGSQKAVDNLTLSIAKGEIFGLLGPNGAGKTTTILMMLGLTEPTSGTATVCGYNATKNPIAVKKKVGYMPDNVGFYDSMTALDNLVYIGRLNGIPEAEVKGRALELLDVIGLGASAHKKTSTFSRGMKQRLGLADVLLKRPEVIILDEPTLGIDPSGVKEFLTLIQQLSREQGLTVLLSSHHLHQVQQVCDRVGLFVNGTLQIEGNMDKLSRKLFANEAYQVSITVREKLPIPWPHSSALKQLPAVQDVSVSGQVVEVSCHSDITPELVRFFVRQGFDVMGVHKKQYELDDIYQKYFDDNTTVTNTHEKSGRLFQRTFAAYQQAS